MHDSNMKDSFRGRGSDLNPSNRFVTIAYEPDYEDLEELPDRPRTTFYRDTSRSVLTANDSPDVRYDVSLNPYRGCEHGCSYCYARPYHEYLGLSAGLDFETKILVKEDAPDLLRSELLSARWKPQTIGISGVTDAYQPIERKLELTRRCLQVLAEFRNPVWIVTKNHLVARDVDILADLARFKAAAVYLSVTTLNEDLRRKMEPRTSSPEQRLGAIRTLSMAGVPVGVLVAPLVPGLTDHEMPAILSAAAGAGAQFASYLTLRLPLAVGPLFEAWLDHHLPTHKEKVLARVRDLHGGRLNDTATRVRMTGKGILADQIAGVFRLALKKSGLDKGSPDLSAAAFRSPIPVQRKLFE